MLSLTKRIARGFLAVFVLLATLLISGCWSSSDIQSRSFVKAMGIDYKDGKFYCYVQFLDFTRVAKNESVGGGSSETKTWVGKGSGNSFYAATTQLYQTVQNHVIWGHISAVVLSESALREHGHELLQMINRYPEVRYNTWLYVTPGSVEEVLSTNGFFDNTVLSTILHDPEPNYKQYSTLPPTLLFQYTAKNREPGVTSYLPSMIINKKTWQRIDKPLPLPSINGAYFQYGSQYKGFLSRKQMVGYGWIQKKMVRAPLSVTKDGEMYAQMSIGKPKISIKPIVEGKKVTFEIKAKYYGALYEYKHPASYEELAKTAEDNIREEIMHTYREALKIGVDIYNLGLVLRHQKLDLWKDLTDNGKNIIVNKDSITKLDIEISIPFNGKYKRRV